MNKKILCFGDSNVYGFNPLNYGRYSENIRWSGLLKEYFKNEIEIVEQGCNNRTIFKNCLGKNLSGIEILPKYLDESFFGIIFLIGINDTQKIYDFNSSKLEYGMIKLIEISKNISPDIKILILSPVQITDNILQSNFAELFDNESIKKSKQISKIYNKISKENNCDFIDLNGFATTSKIDGLHFDLENHKKIFLKVKEKLENWI